MSVLFWPHHSDDNNNNNNSTKNKNKNKKKNATMLQQKKVITRHQKIQRISPSSPNARPPSKAPSLRAVVAQRIAGDPERFCEAKKSPELDVWFTCVPKNLGQACKLNRLNSYSTVVTVVTVVLWFQSFLISKFGEMICNLMGDEHSFFRWVGSSTN